MLLAGQSHQVAVEDQQCRASNVFGQRPRLPPIIEQPEILDPIAGLWLLAVDGHRLWFRP